MLSPPKKNHITCISLLAELAENSAHNTGSRSKSKSKSRRYGDNGGRSRSRGRYSSDMNGYNALVNSTSTIVGGVSGSDTSGLDGHGGGASADGSVGGLVGTVSRSPQWRFHTGKD